MKNYYKILNIQPTATKDEIKKAFRTLAKKYHPDKNRNDENASNKFQDINEAYQVLNSENSRKKYDEKLSKFNENKKETNRSSNHNKSSRNKRTYKDKSDSIENLNKYFESFFGFNANTNEIDKDKLNKKNNPIDTSNMFESFFNIKKK